ncbi:MAG: ABC transporter permease [Candidatus Aminicenantes bacterium]|nr:MAG: ABC transporter permease [Candidatus Aminicenantes bacterium]
MNKKTKTQDRFDQKRNWLRSPLFRAFAALVLVFLIGIMFNADGAFFKWNTHRDMLRHISVFAILACGMTLVIITAGIDLSVGSLLGLTAVLFSLFSLQKAWSPWLALPACLVIGAALGAVSGGLIGRFKIQPFIATLAMMVFGRGMAKWVSGGQKISTAVLQPDGTYQYVDVPPIFEFLNSKLLNENIAVVTLILFGCVLICWVILTKLRWGRYIYAIGGNEEAARLSGIPVIRTKLLTYGLSGFFCAIAGICQAAQELQGDPETGMTYELTAIAIVVIGGTNLMGGRGGIGLTFIGAMTIGYLEKILSINAVGEASRLMLTGAIIVGAVLFQKTRR